jgi:hypothetical protein
VGPGPWAANRAGAKSARPPYPNRSTA